MCRNAELVGMTRFWNNRVFQPLAKVVPLVQGASRSLHKTRPDRYTHTANAMQMQLDARERSRIGIPLLNSTIIIHYIIRFAGWLVV